MPLYLRAPRKGLTPNYAIRGTYLGIAIDESAGTHKKAVAARKLGAIERQIELGTHAKQQAAPVARPNQPTFVSAAISYMEQGGEARYIGALVDHFKDAPLPLSQDAIDQAGLALYPNVTAATRNRQVYTPIAAVQAHQLGEDAPTVRRPKGAKGKTKTDFLWPEDAFALIDAGDAIDPDFGLYLLMLLYHGPRKSEMLRLLKEDARPAEGVAYVRDSKNGDPRMIRLRQDIIARMEKHLERIGDRANVFRWKDGGHFKHLLTRAKCAVMGLPCPVRRPTGWKPPKHRLSFVGFHTFRHTFATWFRMYAGGDTHGLVATKNWKDARSAARYEHVVARAEWDRVDSMPSAGNTRVKTNVA